MAADVKKKVVEVDVKAQKIGELKDQIKELTKLMDTLDTESLEYHKTVDMLVDAEEELTTVMKVGKSQLSAQEGSYNALVNKMAALKKAQKAVTDEASRMRLGDKIREINDELKRIDANNGVYVRNVGDYENAVKKALKTPQQELKALRVQLAQLTEGTAEYNATFARMAQLTHDVTEQQEMLRWSSADLGDILGNIAGVATSIAGGFSAVNALGGLLGMSEDEDLEKAMLQAQRFLQLIQGLEQLEELADKIKGLWKGIQNFGNQTLASAAALGGFSKETKTAAGAMLGASQATSTSAVITGQAAKETNELAAATNNLVAEEQKVMTVTEYRVMIGEKKLANLQAERDATMQLLNAEKAKAKADQDAIEKLSARIAYNDREIEREKSRIKYVKNEVVSERTRHRETAKVTVAVKENTAATNAQTAAVKAQSAANVKAAATTGLFSKALGVLKTALISTGIGAIIAALGALLNLLGKGVKALWGWISGANKAKEQTEALKTAFDALNESLEGQEKSWERQEMLMEAQGKSYEEIYEARKKNLKAQLAEVQALLASQKAIANDIGQRKLQKKKYDDFRETLDELVAKEKELKQSIDDLDYENYINGVKERKKAEEDAAAAAKKAAEQAKAAYDKQKEEADKLYQSLIEHYKTEQQKLKEKYDKEKAMLEKYGKDTTLLTKKYEEDKTAIVLKQAELRRQRVEQFSSDILKSLENPSLEYFKTVRLMAKQKDELFDNFGKSLGFENLDLSPLKNAGETVKMIKAELAKNPEAAETFKNGLIELNKKYKLSMETVDDFVLQFKIARKEFNDASADLDNYIKQVKKTVSDDEVAMIEAQISAIQELTEQKKLEAEQEYQLYESSNNYYTDFENNYISQMYKRWETEDAIYQMRMANLQEMADKYKEASENTMLTDEARLEALKKYKEVEQQITNETAEHNINVNLRETEAIDNYTSAVQDGLGGISQILGDVASAWETSIQAQVDAGEISEEEGEKQMESMKGIQSAIALINALSSAVSSYNSLASIPFVGPALGAAAAAAALASGIAQVVAIQKVKKGDKGSVDSTRYAEVTPTQTDYTPQGITNVTGEQETQNLANAMTKSNIWVSVKDIDAAQSKVKTRDKEATF